MSEIGRRFVASIPEAYDRYLVPIIFEGHSDDLARRAGAVAASRVLELAAGTGILSRKLRNVLGPDARLVITDLNGPMLDIAKRKFSEDDRVEIAEADAMDLPFGAEDFDLVVCQFGVMFFPDKVASFREAARVLCPGGRYIFNTWGPMSANPFGAIVHEVTASFFPDDPLVFYQIPFSYAEPGVVVADLEAAGWTGVEHETVAMSRTVSDFPAFARGLVFGNPMIEEIRQRGGVAPEEVMDAVIAALRTALGPEPATMPLQATVFSGRAP